MATSRLSDDEKQSICRAVNMTTKRAMFNKEFPVPQEEVMDWLIKQMPKPIRKAYILLRADASDLVKHQGFACDFDIHSDTHEYRINIRPKVPRNHILIRKKDYYHADVIKWAKWEVDTQKAVDNATSYFDSLVCSCTSVGQLKRMLPDEIMRFIPSHLLDFSNVERRSRIPASFTPDNERLEAMMHMLTVGSISPEELKGVQASTENYIKISRIAK